MPSPKKDISNFKFLLIEVENQLSLLMNYFLTEHPNLARRIIDRMGYVYTLSMRIQTASLAYQDKDSQNPSSALERRTWLQVALELDKISQLAKKSVEQASFFSPQHQIKLQEFCPLIEKVFNSMKTIEEALEKNDSHLAMQLSLTETQLDKGYQKLLKHFTLELKKKSHTEDLITALFIAQLIEQMGDSLLKIGEAILSSTLGQPMDFQRFEGLQNNLLDWSKTSKKLSDLNSFNLKPVAQTRSGSVISSIQYKAPKKKKQRLIFKDGESRKLQEEVEGVERWHRVHPGVAPKVYTFHQTGNTASVLIEHLQGLTFEQIVLNGSLQLLGSSMKAFKLKLYEIWNATQRKKKTLPAGFIQQIRKRLPDVYAVHPDFRQSDSQIGHCKLMGFTSLLSQCESLEQNIPVPFYVFIHGDFNLDNILFTPKTKKIQFIDLHRSTYQDYIQDVSVFMISNYRLQVMDPALRLRLGKQACDMYKIAKSYAMEHDDKWFEWRLALGLARSFVTSTRFIMDKTLAKRMFLRSHFILRLLLLANNQKPNSLALPIKELFSD